MEFCSGSKKRQDVRCADALFSLASLFANTGRSSEAKRHFKRAEKIYRTVLAANRDGSGRAAKNLAALYQLTDQPEAAASVYAGITTQFRKRGRLGEDEYFALLNKMSFLYQILDQPKKAAVALREFLKIRRQMYGEMDTAYAGALDGLATVLSTLGRSAEALACHDDSLRIYETVVGTHHTEYANTLNNRAFLLEEMGKTAEAVLAHQRVLEIRRECLGLHHTEVADSLMNLAFLHREMGHPDEAKALFQEALAILAAGGLDPAKLAEGTRKVRELIAEMHDHRLRRLEVSGFTPGQAEEISRLHTPNFM